jgi:hypothetical protein
MNCNPIIEDGKVVKNSCLSPDVLVLIKDEFNKYHYKDPIVYKTYEELWHKLKTRLSHCDKEDCWLEQIRDISLRSKIDKMTFAPDQPPSWKKNPTTWLSNHDIMNVLRQYESKTFQNKHKFILIDPSPIDFDKMPANYHGACVTEELCKFQLSEMLENEKTKIGIIFNTDHHKGDGIHWVSLFIDLEDSFIFYFDSNGDPIKPEVKKLVDRIIEQSSQLVPQIHLKFYENYPLEHQKKNTECGMYSLFFIITMLTNRIGKRVFHKYEDKINYFKTESIPDNYVFNHRNRYFNN